MRTVQPGENMTYTHTGTKGKTQVPEGPGFSSLPKRIHQVLRPSGADLPFLLFLSKFRLNAPICWLSEPTVACAPKIPKAVGPHIGPAHEPFDDKEPKNEDAASDGEGDCQDNDDGDSARDNHGLAFLLITRAHCKYIIKTRSEAN